MLSLFQNQMTAVVWTSSQKVPNVPEKRAILWSEKLSYKFFHPSIDALLSCLLWRSSLQLWTSWGDRALMYFMMCYDGCYYFLFYFFSKMVTRKSIFWTMKREDEWAGLLTFMEHVIIPTHSWLPGCIQNTEKQKQAGMFSSILGPAWQLLSRMTMINLHATALPQFPNKREITLFRMDFTPHTLFSQLKLLCHQQTFGHSPRIPSESRKESNPLQAKLIFKRTNLYHVLHHCEFDHLGF